MNTEFQKYLEEMLPQVTFDELSKFKITIEEHISGVFEVEATDIEEAMKIAQQKYHKGEFIVEPSTPTARLMQVEDEYSADITEWVEF